MVCVPSDNVEVEKLAWPPLKATALASVLPGAAQVPPS